MSAAERASLGLKEETNKQFDEVSRLIKIRGALSQNLALQVMIEYIKSDQDSFEAFANFKGGVT